MVKSKFASHRSAIQTKVAGLFPTYEACAAAQVKWYREHGKYPDRICFDNSGIKYVAGDFSWNHGNPATREVIEPQLEQDLLREYGAVSAEKSCG